MKFIYLVLLLLISNIYSQEHKIWNKIEFTQILNSEITKSELYFNENESIYFYGNKTLIDTTTLNITIRKTDDIGNAIYKNKEKNILFTRLADGKEVILINDCFPNLSWKILNETKKVASITLRKATAAFRGRDYIAWFDESIPSDNGPLKMGGLPGLILELSTVDNYLNITFNYIQKNSEEPLNLEKVLISNDRSITQKEWNKENKEQIEAFIRKIKARETRDSVTTITIGEALEKKFEWD